MDGCLQILLLEVLHIEKEIKKDPFRMVANSEFQYELYPSMKFLRIDPYDNQRGEAEYEHMGLGKEALEVTRETIEFKEL